MFIKHKIETIKEMVFKIFLKQLDCTYSSEKLEKVTKLFLGNFKENYLIV